ncbi:MAG: ATP-dependent endonuclease [Vulcanimicrobiota bacterium]
MYLETLALRNFRSFTDLEIPLCKDLTVFVGENNGGKSNAVDAIRLLIPPLNGRRDIYCETTDIRFGSDSSRFEIEARFTELSAAQQGRLLTALTDEEMTHAAFGLEYVEDNAATRPKITHWAGKFKHTPEAGSREMIRHVYLPPLRDARHALASGNPTRIFALLTHFLNGENPDQVAKELRRQNEHPILQRVEGAVGGHLTTLTDGVRAQASKLQFPGEERLFDIARDLRFKLADHGLAPEDLRHSGHGFANLLYMATIAVELEKIKDADLTIFLVEEPEAHLHPQLQAAVLSFLEEKAQESRKGSTSGPAGELQIVVATHSPNLSAWVEGEKLLVFKTHQAAAAVSDAEEPTAGAGEPLEGSPNPPRRETKCIPLRKLGVEADDWRKINRYLDVTRSALLFGGRVLLVEGIAEVLVLPIIAKEFVLKERPKEFRRFRSAVFVSIDGVDFDPWVTLLLKSCDGTRVAERVVVITDGDAHNVTPVSDEEDKPDAESSSKPKPKSKSESKRPAGEVRKERLLKLAEDLDATDYLHVETNTYSFESELVIAGNSDLVEAVFSHCHSRSKGKWDAAIALTDGSAQATAVQKLFTNTRKGDFAHQLAEEIRKRPSFIVPKYLQDAIEALVK